MIEFFPLDKKVNIIKEYIEKSKISFCDLSLGAKFLWRDEFKIDYAVVNDTLILKESCRDYENAFYYPMGKDAPSALLEIENYTRVNHIPLVFCCIDNDTCEEFSKRYFEIEISNDRNWSDYIYTADAFKTYSGKKLSGQRNHVNKFKRLYPDYTFKVMDSGDVDQVKTFLAEFEKGKDFSLWTEKAEFLKLSEYVENASKLNQLGGILKVDNKIVGVSLGEVVKNTLIVHVEKANREFEGAYPMLATCFANAFCDNGVKYINREEDCGDTGLRISKLQYHPIEIKQKNIVRVKTLIQKLFEDISIKTERLTLTAIKEIDKENYFRLYTDDDLNKYWGYEYRDDLGGEKATPEYFYNFQKKMKDTLEEFSFAVRVNGEMVGELVYHNFDYDGGLEIGYRFLREHQRKGYAFEGATALIEYAKNTLGAKTIYTRCDKRNIPSFNLISKLGFKIYKESETHYFFSQKLN